MPANNLVLYAKWAAPKFDVTFNYNDGVTANKVVSVDAGNTVAEPTEPTRTGYTFAGWTLNNAPYNFAALVTGSITLKANWIQNGHGRMSRQHRRST